MAIAAATDYAIFLVGRYHEARNLGDDRENSFYVVYHGTAHVIVGSRIDNRRRHVVPALHPTPLLPDLGLPLAIGMFVVTISVLTLAPALMTIAARFGLLDPKRSHSSRGWRRIGTAVVRWPETGVAVTADSLFQIGSITKLWTATPVMQLLGYGVRELNAPD